MLSQWTQAGSNRSTDRSQATAARGCWRSQRKQPSKRAAHFQRAQAVGVFAVRHDAQFHVPVLESLVWLGVAEDAASVHENVAFESFDADESEAPIGAVALD
eukprot:4113604-Prymnesium_polylepis.1